MTSIERCSVLARSAHVARARSSNAGAILDTSSRSKSMEVPASLP